MNLHFIHLPLALEETFYDQHSYDDKMGPGIFIALFTFVLDMSLFQFISYVQKQIAFVLLHALHCNAHLHLEMTVP